MTNTHLAIALPLVLAGTLSVSPQAVAGDLYVSAKCDGQADDYDAIQGALNQLGKGTRLIFPRNGDCVVKGRLRIRNRNGFEIIGNNASIRMHESVTADSDNYLLRLDNCRSFSIDSLILDGNRAKRDGPTIGTRERPAHNLFILNAQDFTLTDITSINSAMDGIVIAASNLKGSDRSTASQNGLIMKANVQHNWRNGIQIHNADNIRIANSIIANNNGILPKTGINVEANSTSYTPSSTKIVIENSEIYGHEAYGVKLSPKGEPRDAVIRNNRFSDNQVADIGVKIEDVEITNNLFEMSPKPASTKDKGVVSLYRYAERVKVVGNAFETHPAGRALLFVAGRSGTGHVFVDNCIYDVDGPEIRDGRGRVERVSNEFRADGCPDPR